MKKKIESTWCYIVLIIVLIFVILGKKNLHVDEVSSYRLANCVGTDYQKEGYMYEPAGDAYLEYMTVQPGQRFNALNVWYNQSQDTHPPLYYLLLHMICSLFPETFSIWYAGIINIVFAVLTLWCIRRIAAEMTHSDSAVLAVSLAFAVSAGILSNMAFLRMYVMALFFVTYITYLMIKLIKTGVSIKTLEIVITVSILGALTHYYVIVYLFFSCLLMGIYLLIRKNYRQLGMLALSMAAAGSASVLIFPAMLRHMFFGGVRGEESISNLANAADYAERLKTFYGIVNKELFGSCFTYLAAFILILLILTSFAHKLGGGHILRGFTEHIDWIVLILPSACYFLLVAKMAVYKTDRYIFPVYAVVLTWTVCLLYKLGRRLIQPQYQYTAAAVLLSITLVSGWKLCTWDYLYKDTEALLRTAEGYGDVDCVYIYDAIWKVRPSYYEVSKYNSVVFWNVNNMDAIRSQDYCMDRELIVCILNSCDQQSVLNELLSFCPFLNTYDELGGYAYATTYHLYGDNVEASLHHIYSSSHMQEIGCMNMDEDNGNNVCLVDSGTEIMEVCYESEGYVTLWIGGQVLDVKGGRFESGSNIQLFDYNGTKAQRWRLQQNEDGSVTFFAGNSDLIMTYDETGNIILGPKDNVAYGKWWIE